MAQQVHPVSWFIVRDGQQYGPLPDQQMQAMVAQGQLLPTDHIWRDGFDGWRSPSEVFPQAAPVPPPLPLPRRPVQADGPSDRASAARSEEPGTLQLFGVKVFGAVGIAAIVGIAAFYADAVTKVHEAACRVLPMVGISTERLSCAADGQQIARVEKGVARVEEGVVAVQKTAKSTEDQAKVIAKDVDALRRSNDPAAIARQKIEAAGYSLDNAGYIKAVAQGSETAGHFKDLRIHGDEDSLRQALLTHNYKSREFTNLMLFLAKSPSDHYAANVRADVRDFFDGMQRSKSASAAHGLACESKAETFSVRFAKLNLGDACNDNARWVERVVAFGKVAIPPFEDPTSAVFWAGYPLTGVLTFRPTSIATRAIPAAQFISVLKRETALVGVNIQSDVQFSIWDARSSLAIFVFDPATGHPYQTATPDGANLRQSPCLVSMPPPFSMTPGQPSKPRCTGRLTVYSDPQLGFEFISLQNAKVIGGSGDVARPRAKP